MTKRGKLEIIYDILKIVQNHKNRIKKTPLLRQSNISTSRFKEYFNELLEKSFILERNYKKDNYIELTNKGFKFLEKYSTIINFIDEFDL